MAKKKEEKDLLEKIKELEEEITKLKESEKEAKDKLLLAYADTENLKKRLNNEAEQVRKYRSYDFILNILPVIDNLERVKYEGDDENMKNFIIGINMIKEQLLTSLKAEGLSEIEALNKTFDPFKMQAIAQEEGEMEKDLVLEVMQKGYMYKDRLLRAAMVKISK